MRGKRFVLYQSRGQLAYQLANRNPQRLGDLLQRANSGPGIWLLDLRDIGLCATDPPGQLLLGHTGPLPAGPDVVAEDQPRYFVHGVSLKRGGPEAS